MPRYSFPGYYVFLEEAARQIGHPEAGAPAREITPLSALGNRCAQAGVADPAHVPGIMAKAAEFRDQLHAAFKAADLMLSDIEAALALQDEPPQEPKASRPQGPKAKKA
jgi:hypothetical protein